MVTTRDVEYEVAGTTMIGRLALPDRDDLRPAILIAHEGPGLDDFQKDRASTFAELGYVAFALDYHGGGRLLADRDEMMARLAVLALDLDLVRSLGAAGLEQLLREPQAPTIRSSRASSGSSSRTR